jgi:3',5'-cyclic-AMP phosphodiesterase
MRSTLAALFALSLLDCASEAGDRALRDLEVGHAEVDGMRIDVDEGLAAVRHLAPGELHLWAGAPLLDFTITTPAARIWTIAIDNVTSDAALVAHGLDVTPVADEGVRKRFAVDLPAGTTRLSLTTPDAGDRTSWRFGLLSDVQDAIDEVGDVFAVLGAQDIRFVLGAGDLSQRGTTEELSRFQQEMTALPVPYYSTLGNHDAPPATPWHDLFGRGNFRFRFRGVQFTMLDSASATLDPLVREWLDGWLAEAASDVHVVAMHIPLLDPIGVRNGAFGSRHEAGAILARLAAGRVDLTLYGHIHSFYAYDNAGIPAFISGGGGALAEQLDGIGRHVMVIEIGADTGVIATEIVRVD